MSPSREIAARAAVVCLALLGAARLADAAAGAKEPPAWNVPGDVPEMMAACRDIPELYSFSRNGYLSIECGYQAILLGSRIPIAPAPHVPWAKPYAKGPVKVLAICMFGNSPADTVQVAQLARELDCDMRFVLIAQVPLGDDWGKDEGYRLGYLARQAREALKLDYDVILLAMGSYSPGFGYPLQRVIFPDDVYQTILGKVKNGTGLVLIVAAEGSDVFAGAPLESVAITALYQWKPKEGARRSAGAAAGLPSRIRGSFRSRWKGDRLHVRLRTGCLSPYLRDWLLARPRARSGSSRMPGSRWNT